ncbi:DUF4446 family protein [Clostridium sp. Marseille-P3244]|uniref:DUF4446 family protein n=1 Tax=Clostridium sp. Marseille-P3244 TaxID=1871020 RepID=UPI00093001B7|nr:DUF4446 family protein [Clostridium sp. Marseille-P3244]
MNGILESMGVDPFYLFVVVFILLIALIIIYSMLNYKYKRLLRSYSTFMRGKNGKDLEKSIFKKFEQLEEISQQVDQNKAQIQEIFRQMEGHYQKAGIVKYDAFQEMGGTLSFVLTMLDSNNNGWIFNAMHSREGCYTYIKEIIKGESYIELSEEERQCLEKTIYQEEYDIKDMKEERPSVKKKNEIEKEQKDKEKEERE